MKKGFSILYAAFVTLTASAQEIVRDSTLGEVVVQAYSSGKPSHEVAGSINTVSAGDLSKNAETSFLPAVNVLPGVRMEERSPGSYRFTIRGSSLRAPFGVRNVKVYWNGLPFTDGGGNTYLNLIDLNAVGGIEVIKGPGGSLYGAGTGGVLLFSTPTVSKRSIGVATSVGSYGLLRFSGDAQLRRDNFNGRVLFTHQAASGYRAQSAMTRDMMHGDFRVRVNEKNVFAATLFYTDLYYETPGGLNLQQFTEDPSQARPATATAPGAAEQHARVMNETFYGGVSHDHYWNERLQTTTGICFGTSEFRNAAIANYEFRDEKNVGMRTLTKYTFGKRKSALAIGGEFQTMDSPILVTGNNGGSPTSTISSDSDLQSSLGILFLQLELALKNDWTLTSGVSANLMAVDFTRIAPGSVKASRNFDPELSPRLAVLKKITERFSLHGSVASGFSPPTIAELYPSRQVFDQQLQPERGINFELGGKGYLLDGKLYFDLTAYSFRLKETIVIRRDGSLPGEPEYFVNAGNTRQRGVEAMVVWNPLREASGTFSDLKITGSYAYQRYRFGEYVQSTDNFEGNKLTGIPPTLFSIIADAAFLGIFYVRVSANYVDHIPLNDGNTVYAQPYTLVAARIGTEEEIGKHHLDVFAGIDNALDKTYSLGNDLNAFGGRYFNAAPRRNFYFGIRFDLGI